MCVFRLKIDIRCLLQSFPTLLFGKGSWLARKAQRNSCLCFPGTTITGVYFLHSTVHFSAGSHACGASPLPTEPSPQNSEFIGVCVYHWIYGKEEVCVCVTDKIWDSKASWIIDTTEGTVLWLAGRNGEMKRMKWASSLKITFSFSLGSEWSLESA